MDVLSVCALSKKIGRNEILKEITFKVRAGEVVGFLGPNGAGKSTTMKIICGLSFASGGEVIVCGNSIQKDFIGAVQKIGAAIEITRFFEFMSARENLEYLSILRGGINKARIEGLARFVGLEQRLNDKVWRFSVGMKQRLALASALLGDPPLLVLDEPTNGLDPLGSRQMRRLFVDLAHKCGKAVLISSHNLFEMQEVCDYACIVNQGEIVAKDNMKSLLSKGSNLEEVFLRLVHKC